MKSRHLLYPLLALLALSSQGFGANISSDITTSFSNMQGSSGENSSVVYSDTSASPILKGTGYIAIGTFNLNREQIAALPNAGALEEAFHQFGRAINFNALEDGAFQGSALGNPGELYDGTNSFIGSKIHVVIGNGDSLGTSTEFLVWNSGSTFDNTGPTGNSWEVFLSAGSGDLIIGLDNKNTSDFSLIGGDAQQAAFTTVKIDATLDDHGNSAEYATTILENSSTSGIIADGEDVDFFRVQLSDDGSLSIRVLGSFNAQLILYDSQGAQVTSGQAVEGGFDIITDLPAGTYFVSVGGDDNTSNEAYSLKSAFQSKIIDLDPEAAGEYYGLVKDAKNRPMGRMSVTIAQDGSYSGTLDGFNRSKRFLKGFVRPDNSVSVEMKDVQGKLSTVEFAVTAASTGRYRLPGQFQRLTANQPHHSFSLRQARYSQASPPPSWLRGRYTLRVPSFSTSDNQIPAGDGLAEGNLSSSGIVKLRGYSNSGARFSYSCPMLEGNLITFYTRPQGRLEALVGDLSFRDKEESDLRGRIRYYRRPSSSSYYTERVNKFVLIEGSKYKKPTEGSLPLRNFAIADDNALATYTGGSFDDLNYLLTWSPSGEMIATETVSFGSSALFNNKNGQFLGELIIPLQNDDTTEVKTYLRGVVLQKQGIVVGQAETAGGTVGSYSLVPAP
ncbi:MAG: hypothetical protein ACPH2J_01425 [Akkermansiaceae bacterium]